MMVGRTLSHYRIVSQLGAGGMGVVYRAEDVRLGREVAVKVVSQDFANDQQALQRLRSEARAASALNHPNICTIFDIGEDEGRPFVVMELMRGATLRDHVDSSRMRVSQLVDIGIEVADALQATHNDGIIHRDIKPGNIFLTDRGHVKLLDFGLAKLTEDFTGTPIQETLDRTAVGVALGTISYMSPEQATGEPLDGRTDLFSLGVVLYECATGRHPFSASSSAVTLAGILNKAPVSPLTLNPDLPLRLQEIISNCLEKDRELRYQSAADLRADLKRLRRDLESGQSQAVEAVSGATTSRPVTSATATARTASMGRSTATTVPMPAVDVTTVAHPVAPAPSRAPLYISIAALVAVLVVGYVLVQRDAAPVPAPGPGSVAPGSSASIDTATLQNRLGLATASFSARNYRAAAAYAAEVLAIDPRNADAIKIRDESAALLERFEARMADARQRLAAGDIQAAVQALEAARALDPTAPSVLELSSRLQDALRLRQAQRDDRSASARGSTSSPAAAAAPPAAPAAVAAAAPPATAAPSPSPAPAPAVPTPPSPPPPVVVVPSPPPAPVVTTPAPSTPPAPAPAPAAPTPSAAEQDDAAIRRLTASYARAIETKDIGLFRSIKPNLSREEERRLMEGFKAVTSQRVNATILSIDRKGDEAVVVLRRRDTIQAQGREQTAESQQTLRLTRTGGTWVIVEIR